MPPTSPSVLLIRLDGIGDALALCPLVEALHAEGYPIDAILTAQNVDAFSHLAFRERWIAPFALRDGSRENLRTIASFGTMLRGKDYSHVMVATEDPGGYRLARATNAPNRIGFANGWGKPLKTLWVRSLLTTTLYRAAGLDGRARHECEVLFELGHGLVDPSAPARTPAELRRFVVCGDLTNDGRIGFQVTDKWERLNIPFDQVTACARKIDRATIRAFGATHESSYIDRFERATGIAVERFDTVPQWKVAIAGSGALIAPDGGAIHVAGMVGTPVVAVFPPTLDFALQTARWAPWAAPSRIVRADGAWAKEAAVGAMHFIDNPDVRTT